VASASDAERQHPESPGWAVGGNSSRLDPDALEMPGRIDANQRTVMNF
jgi:hypothetical protein